MDIKNFLDKLLKDPNGILNKQLKDTKKLMMNLIIIFLCGVLLILIGDISTNMLGKKSENKKNSIEVNTNNSNSTITPQNQAPNNYEEQIKSELINTLSEIDGVGKIKAMIYFEGGSQNIPAVNINDSDKKTQEKDNTGGTRVTTEKDKNQNIVLVNENGESKPFIVKQYNPPIGGVVVVAEGASDAIIRERLLIAVKTALNIPSSKVSIMPMKRSYEK